MYLLKNKEIHIALKPKANNRLFNHRSSDDEVRCCLSSSKNRAEHPWAYTVGMKQVQCRLGMWKYMILTNVFLTHILLLYLKIIFKEHKETLYYFFFIIDMWAVSPY